MAVYGCLARPAHSHCAGTGAKALAHDAFKFGAIEVADRIDRGLAMSMGLVMVPTAADWPALAAEAAGNFMIGDRETRVSLLANPKWRRDIDDALDSAIREMNIHATRAEMLAALESLDGNG